MKAISRNIFGFKQEDIVVKCDTCCTNISFLEIPGKMSARN